MTSTQYYGNYTQVKQPLNVEEKPMNFDVAEYEKLMSSDSKLQKIFQKQFAQFWCNVKDEQLQLHEKCVQLLFFFLATYLEEPEFSSYTLTVTSYQSRLSPEYYLKYYF